MTPSIKAFFDKHSSTLSYVVADPASHRAAVVDPVLDYEARAGRTSTVLADEICAFVRAEGLTVDWILETHVHADHLSAGGYLREQLGAKLAIGEHVTTVQSTWKGIYNLPPGFPTDGSQFDHRFRDGEAFQIGGLSARVMHTPGHTPACITYIVEDRAWVGDTMFMPDYGTSRVDFPGGDAATLYRSIRRLFELPASTRLYMCHDYMPHDRPLAWETTVAEQKAQNVHVHDGVTEEEFVRLRIERDKTLPLPELLLPAVQVNVRGGALPPAEENGTRYLKIPVNYF
jgi:glyoxylase-like metal-dependent hydrolase (beta-lactamase superfamily II)